MTLPTNHVPREVITAADINAIAASANASSLKAMEDATTSIYALAPSPESGLTAIAADASTNDAPRIQALLDYLKATYGGGKLILPYGKTSNCNSTITIPAGVQVVGSKTSVWDFWYAGSDVIALQINDKNFTPIVGLKIHGNQWDANTPNHNTTTSLGMQLKGYALNFVDVHISGFNTGMDLTNDDTYIISFQQSSIENCMVGVNLDLSNVWTGGSRAVNNSGERITFTDCLFANCDTFYWATGEGVGLYFAHTSMDFPRLWGRQQNSHVFFDNCHLESTFSDGLRYMFDLAVNSRLNMVNCNVVLGAPGIYYVLNTVNGPWNTGWGMAHFSSSNVYFAKTEAAGTAGAIGCGFSETVVPITKGATSVTLASPFISKWSSVKVSVVPNGSTPAANVTARITAINIVAGTVVVTFSAAAPSGTYIEVDF